MVSPKISAQVVEGTMVNQYEVQLQVTYLEGQIIAIRWYPLNSIPH